MQPAACGIMSLSEARRLQQSHFNMHPVPPATSTSGAASGEQRYCVWVHAHCDKFQPRSDRLCRSGFREVRVLSCSVIANLFAFGYCLLLRGLYNFLKSPPK
jgi:hypothetical protein